MSRRAEILQELVLFEKPSESLLQELKSFGWDWTEAPLLTIKKEDLLRIVDRFLTGQLSALQLQEWAENLETREDVAFDEKDAEIIDDIFFQIATPMINGPLTSDAIRKMREMLQVQ